MSEYDSLVKDLDAVVTKHKQEKKEKEQKKKEIKKTISVDDLKKLLEDINAKKSPDVETTTQPIDQAQQPMKQKQPTKDQQIAYQLWKDSKATSIVCLIAMIFPMITALISMFPGGVMAAMMVAFIGLIYPCLVLVKMIGIQTRAYKKYGLKPMFLFKQQQPQMMPQQQQSPGKKQQEFF